MRCLHGWGCLARLLSVFSEWVLILLLESEQE
jgi:hypothetical protein